MSVFNALSISRLILVLELIIQIAVIATEAISNARYKKFPASTLMIGYTGQSLLVIIVAIIQLSVTALVARNLRYVLSNSTWKVSGACIIFSLASVCFRALTSWFIQDPKSFYYIVTYNITSICILIGCGLWVPFIFCKSDKYYTPPSSDTSRADSNYRSRIVTTTGSPQVSTYRPNNTESDEELPSYYEMIPPPAYKKKPNNTTSEAGDGSYLQAETIGNNVGPSSHIATTTTNNNT